MLVVGDVVAAAAVVVVESSAVLGRKIASPRRQPVLRRCSGNGLVLEVVSTA